MSSSWEKEDFPIVCETCLGDNPYLRMTKEPYAKECKICQRPFTVFRWKPGKKARYKKTEICQTCAKVKNVCQTCILDLQYGLPVQVRDSVLAESEKLLMPQSEANREYFQDQIDKKIAQGVDSLPYAQAAANEAVLRLARKDPYYRRNLPRVCSFWLKGECNRGSECPYRHEFPDEKPELAKQNIKDRFYGVKDPVAEKLLSKAEAEGLLRPPEDKTITTLYVGNVTEDITEEDLKDHFYGYGEIAAIKAVRDKSCAFVSYTTREAAELAAESLSGKLIVKGKRLKLLWAKPIAEQAGQPRTTAPNPPTGTPSPFLLPAAGYGKSAVYPSMLPRQGAQYSEEEKERGRDTSTSGESQTK